MIPISSSAVAQWNMGRTKPTRKKIERMAAILEVDPSYLGLGDVEDVKEDRSAEGSAVPKSTQKLFDFASSCSTEELDEIYKYIDFIESKRGSK